MKLKFIHKDAGYAPDRNSLDAMLGTFRQARLDYSISRPSKYRRARYALGGTADAHQRVSAHVWMMREYARDFDRNDTYVGQMFDRACDNILGLEADVEPMTGDPALDLDLKLGWRAWALDPMRADKSKRHTYDQLEWLALRATFVDGDIFGILVDDGSLQLLEGDRAGGSTYDNVAQIINGIEIDAFGAPQAVWFSREPVGSRRVSHTFSEPHIPRRSDTQRIEVMRAGGMPRILHSVFPKRTTQTRGVSVMAPVLDRLGQIEDLDFAAMVQAQFVSCIAAFIRSDAHAPIGDEADPDLCEDSDVVNVEEVTPGSVIRLRDGEDMQQFNPQVPGPMFAPHMKHLLRSVGLPMGMPLELLVLDTSDSTFHGFRAAMEQARMTFKRVHRDFVTRFRKPVYRAYVARTLGIDDPNDPKLRCRVEPRGWPYFDPKKDAEADEVSLKNNLNSRRRLLAVRGLDILDVDNETLADNVRVIQSAQEAAARLEGVTWQEVLGRDAPAEKEVAIEDPEDS